MDWIEGVTWFVTGDTLSICNLLIFPDWIKEMQFPADPSIHIPG